MLVRSYATVGQNQAGCFPLLPVFVQNFVLAYIPWDWYWPPHLTQHENKWTYFPKIFSTCVSPLIALINHIMSELQFAHFTFYSHSLSLYCIKTGFWRILCCLSRFLGIIHQYYCGSSFDLIVIGYAQYGLRMLDGLDFCFSSSCSLCCLCQFR